MDPSFQVLDILVAIVIVASAGYAIYRGFVNETLSIVSWLAAALITIYFGPLVAHNLGDAVSPKWMGELCGFAGLFLIVLIPLSFMTFRLAQTVKRSKIGPLDRSLGAVFGIVRGLFLLGLLYLLFGFIVPLRDQPRWISGAYSLPLVDGAAEVITSLVPRQYDLSKAAPAEANTGDENTVTGPSDTGASDGKNEEKGEDVTVTKLIEKDDAASTQKKIYGAKDRRALDNLIETTKDGKHGKP
jgi:membrane protein required for colicin V production